ncbi:alanine:cation symporter family protein [Brachybacterium sp. EF45031]|uniref:alanine/glycine:cation symporter family protein n=1 Tax=Brachybacterium sillae TaxID=2810536 RepID=UPI00217EC43A|nr:alanine/glycine:cation symporter family protein [Brachybacterium sillae]MCS6711501.1 alanine:cation symporter family protein [Brachybacterium sillae]
MNDIIGWLASNIQGTPFIVLCLGAGLYFTIRSKLLQVVNIPDMLSQLKNGEKSADGVSSFQSLMMSLAGRVGTGNIAGVATAIAFGGPGAIFWMWAMAFLGAATSFIECTLGQIYKERDRDTGEYRGGPAYYIEKAYAHKARVPSLVYAIAFAVVSILALSFFLPGVQANGISTSIEGVWGLPLWIPTAVTLAVLLVVIIGGLKSIANFASLVVPVMAIVYILLALVIFAVNFDQIVPVFSLIFRSAFGADAVFGGLLGTAVMWGVKRGLYSNEAGQGTGPHSAAAAEVSHPAKQGFAQAFAVYIDTLFVCSATAFMILSTGMYRVFSGGAEDTPVLAEGSGGLADTVKVGPGYTQAAIDTLLPGFGASFVAVALFFFAFTTVVGYYYMAEVNLVYLSRWIHNAGVRTALKWLLRLLVVAAVWRGGTSTETGPAWAFGDVGVGAMAWLNIVAILILQVPAWKALKDYREQKKAGLDPQFDPRRLGIRNADFWEQRADELGLARDGATAGTHRRDVDGPADGSVAV